MYEICKQFYVTSKILEKFQLKTKEKEQQKDMMHKIAGLFGAGGEDKSASEDHNVVEKPPGSGDAPPVGGILGGFFGNRNIRRHSGNDPDSETASTVEHGGPDMIKDHIRIFPEKSGKDFATILRKNSDGGDSAISDSNPTNEATGTGYFELTSHASETGSNDWTFSDRGFQSSGETFSAAANQSITEDPFTRWSSAGENFSGRSAEVNSTDLASFRNGGTSLSYEIREYTSENGIESTWKSENLVSIDPTLSESATSDYFGETFSEVARNFSIDSFFPIDFSNSTAFENLTDFENTSDSLILSNATISQRPASSGGGHFFDDLNWKEAPNITALIGQFYADYEFISEAYIMSIFAALGIIANFVAMAAIAKDGRMLRMTRIIHNIFLASEQIFLSMAIAFLQLRTHAIPILGNRGSVERLEIMNYFTSFFGLSQTMSTWLLYVTATESYRTVRQLVDPVKGSEMSSKGCPRNALITLFIGLAYFSAFLPPVRIEIHRLITGGADSIYHQLCNVPIENHWDFSLGEVSTKDLFYILYYSLSYILLDYVLPFIFICSRDKDIIDILHRAQKIPGMISNYSHILCPAVAVSVMCNIYLVCIALKLIILIFKILELAKSFFEDSVMFFRYLNVYSNFLQILKSSLHCGIILLYNDRLRAILLKAWRRRRNRNRRQRARPQLRRQSTINRSQTITTVV